MITTELVVKNNFGNQNTRLVAQNQKILFIVSVAGPHTFYPSSNRVFER